MLEYMYNDGLKGDLQGTQRWHKSDSPSTSFTLDQGTMAELPLLGALNVSQLYPQVHALLIPHTHHLLFPLGAAHTRDLLVKELDGIVHARRQGTALSQEAKTTTPYICATLHNLQSFHINKKFF